MQLRQIQSQKRATCQRVEEVGEPFETGGPAWAAERDGAERLRNVEQIRGLDRADSAEEWLTHSITVPPTNPWSSYGQHTVWSPRIVATNAGIVELPIDVSPIVPASEMQGFAETLRRHYQSEETAQKLDERDRSLQMPPRTVADANPQLNGWMAQVALTNAKLEINDDTMRRADSGKFDDGGREETKELAKAFKTDPAPEDAANKQVVVEAPNGNLNAAFQKQWQEVQRQFERGELNEPFRKGLWKGFYEDGLKQTAKALMELPGDAWGILKAIPRFLGAVWDTAQAGAKYVIWAGIDYESYSREQREYVDEVYEKKVAPMEDLVREFQRLKTSDLLRIFQGQAEQLEGKLSDNAMLIAMTVGEQVGEIIQALTTDPTMGPKGAELAGRIIGMVLYNAAESAVLTAATAGASSALAAQKARKIVSRLEEVAKGTLKKFPRVEEKIKSAILLWDKVRGSHMCFVAGTPVHTLNGLKRIEDVRVGDLVLTRPEDWTGGAAPADYKPVLQTFVTHPSELLHITVETDSGERETIVGTGPHPFYVERARAFVPASDLQPGDRLSLPEGRSASVLSIRHERAAAGSTFTTYNFEVADHHTYFVGKQGVWVHNKGATPCQFAAAKFEKSYDKAIAAGLTPQAARVKGAEDALHFLDRYRTSRGISADDYIKHRSDVFRELKAKHNLSDDDLAVLRAPANAKKLVAGTEAHKLARWQEYVDSFEPGNPREGKPMWNFKHWSTTYEENMVRAKKANVAVDKFHSSLGWDDTEVTVKIKGFDRRLDIADQTAKKGIEYKTGTIYNDEAIRWVWQRDKWLVDKGWDIEWVFEGTASQPLVDALKAAGIKVRVR